MLLVTGNQGKLKEFRRLAPMINWETLGTWEKERGIEGPDIIEDADSFAGNAVIKARTGYQRTGIVSLADDSGLCVDALNGAPGIYSARYAEGTDEDRYQALLTALKDVEDPNRGASFQCALAICGLSDDQVALIEAKREQQPRLWNLGRLRWFDECLVASGQCRGLIRHAPSGHQGFGYDPVFQLLDGRSFASIKGEEKDQVSHRGDALKSLMTLVEIIS